MRVNIGTYKNWIGPYQIAEKILFWKNKTDDDDDHVYRLGEWLSINRKGEDSLLTRFCQFINSKRHRKIEVRIDEFDTWSADHTLSLIIHPMLIQLKESKHGAPNTDDEDVPVELRSTSAPPKEDPYDTDANHFLRWNYILDQMIWSFEHVRDGDNFDEDQFRTDGQYDAVKTKIYNDKIQNGLRLFGKYYQALWD
jgi:hypothetical protein